MATSQWPLLSIILLPGVPARAPRHFWCLGTVENPLSPKISRRNTQELAQPPPHLLKPEFTSYSRFAYSKNNTWMCSWAPSSSQQGLNLQFQHVWGYLKAVSSWCWFCLTAAASSIEALVKKPHLLQSQCGFLHSCSTITAAVLQF